MDYLGLLLGVPLGAFASFVAWLIVVHVIVPKVVFSEDVSRTSYRGNASGLNYRVKFSNAGRRDIIDVEVVAEIRITGLSPGSPTMVEIARLDMDASRIPVIRRGGNRIISLKPENTERFRKPVYGAVINQKLEHGLLTLDDLLAAGESATLRMFVFGYDRWSGSRKLYESDFYTSSSVKWGRWQGMEIEPDPEAEREPAA